MSAHFLRTDWHPQTRNDPQNASRSWLERQNIHSGKGLTLSNLFLFQRDAWILGCGSVAAAGHDKRRDQKHGKKRRGENPQMDRHPVGESGKVPVNDPPGQWNS